MEVEKMLAAIDEAPDYKTMVDLLTMLATYIQRGGDIPDALAPRAKEVALKGLKKIQQDLPALKTFKEQTPLFRAGFHLEGMFGYCAHVAPPTAREKLEVDEADKTLKKYNVPQSMIDEIMGGPFVDGSMAGLIDTVRKIDEEDRRGVFLNGLLDYRDELKSAADSTKKIIADYLASEFDRFLGMSEMSEGAVDSVELLVDVCRDYMAGEQLKSALSSAAELPYDNIKFYTLDSMLKLELEVPQKLIDELAASMEYASMTYFALAKANKESKFPDKYSEVEWLAQSDLVHWLAYPTELGKVPDDISFIGDVKVKKDIYFVYKYKSDSDNLSDENKNRWLIGWTKMNDHSAFSTFLPLDKYVGKTLKKTLKTLAKKVVGKMF